LFRFVYGVAGKAGAVVAAECPCYNLVVCCLVENDCMAHSIGTSYA